MGKFGIVGTGEYRFTVSSVRSDEVFLTRLRGLLASRKGRVSLQRHEYTR